MMKNKFINHREIILKLYWVELASRLASLNEPARLGSLFLRAKKSGSARLGSFEARELLRAEPSRSEPEPSYEPGLVGSSSLARTYGMCRSRLVVVRSIRVSDRAARDCMGPCAPSPSGAPGHGARELQPSDAPWTACVGVA